MRPVRWSRASSLLLLWGAVAIAVGICWWALSAVPEPGPILDKIPEKTTKALEITLEMNKMVSSMALLIFAAFGALLTTEVPRISLEDTLQAVLATISLTGATICLYLSYVIYDKLVEMLTAGFLDLNNSLLLVPREAQVDSLLVSIVALAACVLARPRGKS
jgi:hypothetical protein